MPITWRPAHWSDIEPSLAIQPNKRGDALVDAASSVAAWKCLYRDPFFASAVLESRPAIHGHRLIGFGASVFVSSAFADAEIANPRPDMNSRIIASIVAGHPVLMPRLEVAHANAVEGVNLVILCASWRDGILNAAETQEVQTRFATSFTRAHAGWRFRSVLHETADAKGREFIDRSAAYRTIATFPETGHVLHRMTRESVQAVPGSLGNVLFTFREPRLRLRDSDQQLLLAALTGATDQELATELDISSAAVKARWRSTIARIAETRPDLVTDIDDREGRGSQKRHRVLAYMRSHMQELRPYDWRAGREAKSLS